jgi:hypothetical protein
LSALQIVKGLAANILGIKKYWQAISFNERFQENWLSISIIHKISDGELFINFIIPLVFTISICFVSFIIFTDIIKNFKKKRLLEYGSTTSLSLLIGIISITLWQTTKNFYESGLIFPVIILAILLVIPSINKSKNFYKKILIVICLIGICNQFILINKFKGSLIGWNNLRHLTFEIQNKIKILSLEAGLNNNDKTSRVLMDPTIAYGVLWKTREPQISSFYYGSWWAKDVIYKKILREKKISFVVGNCKAIPINSGILKASDGEYCIYKTNFKWKKFI